MIYVRNVKEEYEYLRWFTVHIKHRNTTTNYVRRRRLTEEVSDPEVDDDLCNVHDQADDDGHNIADDETDPVIDDVKVQVMKRLEMYLLHVKVKPNLNNLGLKSIDLQVLSSWHEKIFYTQ